MLTKKNILHQSEGIPFIDLWSMFYLLVVYVLTLIVDEANMIVFAVYFVCAIPFFHHLDKFACICFLLSTMSYYFLGADEGIWSLYTILALLMAVQFFTPEKIDIPIKNGLYLLWMIIAVALSYNGSRFQYTNGMFAMMYNLVIAVLIVLTVKIDKDTLKSFLPKMASIQLVVYIAMLLINGHYDGYGFSISEKVNHNTFGVSVAILSIIVFAKIVFFEGNTVLYKLVWCMSLALIFISGSRNSLLAMVLTSVVIYMAYQKQQGKTISGGFKVFVAACAVVLCSSLLLPEFGVDLSRYDYVELIESGGSNRTIIWEALSPIIWREHRWFGYGPGHFCSEQMINKIMDLNYKHTHNTIFEAWGELGLFGLIPFLLLLLSSLKKSWQYQKSESSRSMIGFIFFAILLLGLGESLFANIEIWMVIGFLLGSWQKADAANSDATKQGR